MARKSKTEKQHQERMHSSLQHEVEQYREFAAWLPVAKQLAGEAERLVAAKYPSDGSAPDPESFGYEFEDIGELAYSNMRKQLIAKAMEELTARYEQEHRAHLYDRAMKEIEHQEGADISLEVRQRIETDPELSVELRDSARKELGARALGVVHTEITAEQQKIVDAEAERQLDLDRLDVKFAHDRELDLVSDDVHELLEPGDKLELFYEGDKDKNSPIEFTWTKDAKGKEGWVWTRVSKGTVATKSNRGYWEKFEPSANVFVTIGVINKDLETGKDVVQPNKIVAGLPLIVITAAGKNIEPKTCHTNYYGEVHNIQPLLIASTDFQTKDLVFTKNTDKKEK